MPKYGCFLIFLQIYLATVLVDVLYNMGIRLAGLTYSRKAYIGDGIFERNDGGLSEFGLGVVQRMNALGMVLDASHASFGSAIDAIEASKTPVTFSHDGSYTLASGSLQARRLRKDEELLACVRKGGVIRITAVPNWLSNDPEQSIECVLDRYDYIVNLVGRTTWPSARIRASATRWVWERR